MFRLTKVRLDSRKEFGTIIFRERAFIFSWAGIPIAKGETCGTFLVEMDAFTDQFERCLADLKADHATLAEARVHTASTGVIYKALGSPEWALEGTAFSNLQDLPNTLTIEADMRILANILSRTPITDILSIVARAPLSVHSNLALTAPSLNDLLHFLSELWSTYNPHVELRLTSTGKQLILRPKILDVLHPFRPYLEAIAAVLLAKIIDQFRGIGDPALVDPDQFVLVLPEGFQGWATEGLFHFASFSQQEGQLASVMLSTQIAKMKNPQFHGDLWKAARDHLLSVAANSPRESRLESEIVSEEIGDFLTSVNRMPQIGELSERLGFSSTQLNLRIRKEGTSFRELSLMVRMQKGKSLIENSSLSIAEVSKKLGYNSSTNFIRAFKKFYGVTPELSRKNSSNIE